MTRTPKRLSLPIGAMYMTDWMLILSQAKRYCGYKIDCAFSLDSMGS